MNVFDTAILEFLNQFSRLSWTFDSLIKFISGNHLAKGGVLILILWWAWFRVSKDQALVRVHLISTLISCFIGMVIAKSLALTLPFRFRPLHVEDLNLVLPYGVNQSALEGWSSFPSDHSVLFYALAIGMFYVSRTTGILAIVYTTLLIALPRVYLGLHYPTDIIAGIIIGLAIVLACNTPWFVEKISRPIFNFSTKKPEYFYPILFLITYQIVDLFSSGLNVLYFVKSIVDELIG